MLEVQYNFLNGFVVPSMRFLPELTYVNLSFNKFEGPALVLEAAQKLEGLDMTGVTASTFIIADIAAETGIDE